MPIYEFHCKDCRSEFKTLRRTEQTSGVTCPTCGTERVARLLSVTAKSSSESGDFANAMPTGGGCCMGNAAMCGCRN